MGRKTRKQQLQQNRPWHDLFEELRGESERAAAVVGGEMIDAALYRLLTNFLIEDEDVVEYLLEHSLSSPDAKIKLCYCLGLITKGEKDLLTAIRQIRNHFAHQLFNASFTDQDVRNYCERLKSYGGRFITHLPDPSPRDYFQTAVGMLVYALGVRSMTIERRRRAVAPTVQELLQGSDS